MTKEEFDVLSKEVYRREGIGWHYYKYQSCVAEVAIGTDDNGKWATIYTVVSAQQGKGHCQTLLRWLQYKYKDWQFGSSVALDERLRHILQKLGITEYRWQ